MQAEWLTVKDAATAARVSERTVWRWVKAGAVVSRVSDVAGRPIREVRRGSWPSPAASGTHHAGGTDPRGQGQADSSAAESVALTVSDPALAAVLGALVGEVKHLRAAVEAQETTIRELRALPAPEPEAPGLAEEVTALRAVVDELRAELARERRPWWRVWRRPGG